MCREVEEARKASVKTTDKQSTSKNNKCRGAATGVKGGGAAAPQQIALPH